MSSVAVDVDQMKTIAVGLVIAFAVAAILVALLVRALVAKLIIVLVLVGLGIVVWNQRSSLDDCSASFFGYDITIDNADIRARCQEITSEVS